MSDLLSPSLERLDIINFRRFPSISIDLNTTPLIIYGPNGSGKTQIFWSLLYFFMGHNMRFEDSLKRAEVGVDIGKETGDVIHPSLVALPDYKILINDKSVNVDNDGHPNSKFVGHFSYNKQVEVCLKANGVLRLVPPKVGSFFEKKIGFAHLLPFYFFTRLEAALGKRILNNFQHNLRGFYSKLATDYTDKILKHVQDLFGSHIKKIHYDEDEDELSIHQDNKKFSILSMGSAFQKILSSLIIFYNLLMPRTYTDPETEEKKLVNFSEKYLLVEEPEALLYSSLTISYYELLVDICKENNIKLIVTTNDPAIIDLAPRKIGLSLDFPRIVTNDEEQIRKLLGHQVLDPNKELYLICEGSSDVHFLKHIITIQYSERKLGMLYIRHWWHSLITKS